MTERQRLDAYVQWNQCTRHQLITAHLTLIDAGDEARVKLAKAFGIESYLSWDDLIEQVVKKAKKTQEATVDNEGPSDSTKNLQWRQTGCALSAEERCNRAEKRIAELEAALKDARSAIYSLPDDALGFGGDEYNGWSIKHELLYKIDKASER